MARWGLFIDLEGFGSRYRKSEVAGLTGLRDLGGVWSASSPDCPDILVGSLPLESTRLATDSS